ncbi:MAG: hypothetical protein LBJ67_01540 [Planctomycetaceae bacterium]|jgi:hypothetical protein|nr:hypothetical protein [Planctomycetaceae bacterium]
MLRTCLTVSLFLFLSAVSFSAELTPESPIVQEWMRQDGRTAAPDADYIQSCQKRRDKRLKTLKNAFPKIIFAKHFDLGGSHYAYTEAQSDAQAERNFVPGTALCLLELNDDGEYSNRTLIDDPNGIIRDPAVSYDGKTIVFAWKKSDFLDDYHLYSYDVASGNIRQLTFGLGYADYEPCLLPNGDIIFNSTRCVQIVDCWWTEVSNLYRCDKDGRFLRRLSFDQVHTNFPSVLEDGRIVYTRWDYNDRGQIFPQGLFQMNPDGTAQTEYYGNNSWFPTTLLHARGIPNGGGKLVAVFSGHHNRQYGKLGIIDVTKGRQENSGTQLIAPIRETKADRIDAWGQQGDRFAFPYPINEHEFLAGYNPNPNAGHTTTTPFGIYWIDESGQRELLAYDSAISSHQPVPLAARAAPYERTIRVNNDANYGTFTLQDVYAGPGLQGIERGTAKTLRVIALEFRSVGIGSNHNVGPAGSAMISTPISIGNGTWDVKIPLGDTPIYEDGSASFLVPAKTPLYFQILDENGHAIQTMRSWSTLQPGEVFSCIGCHEDKNTTLSAPSQTIALQKGAQPLKPFYGKPRGFNFDREIQPILDKHCVECHNDAQRKPDFAHTKSADVSSDETVAFSLKGGKVEDLHAKRYWSLSYLNLTNYQAESGGVFSGRQTPVVNWINVQESPAMLPPYQSGAAKSGLMKMLDPKLAADGKTHSDVKLTREELDKMAAWIDLLVPAYGDYKEGNLWDERELQKHAYYEIKRRDMRELDAVNHLQLISYLKDGKLPIPAQEQNVYRNLALNPGATDVKSNEKTANFPAASSNSVYKSLKEFAASNCLDGKMDNKGHGAKFPSWGPDNLSEKSLWWQVDFGKPVKADQIAIVIRADFPHDTYWKECTIECSNGFTKKIALRRTTDKQIFTFPVQDNVTWLRLTNFVPEQENVWAALTEVEVYGIDAE